MDWAWNMRDREESGVWNDIPYLNFDEKYDE